MTWSPWDEEEYAEALTGERRRYAWVMRRYGGLTSDEAEAAALERYPYEPSDTPYRGIIFHREAWQWAMRSIHGHDYWLTHPELASEPAAYRALG